MQHPEFEEGPCTTSRPDPVPGLDAQVEHTDPEQIVSGKSKRQNYHTARARASSSRARSARARAHRETGEPTISQGI